MTIHFGVLSDNQPGIFLCDVCQLHEAYGYFDCIPLNTTDMVKVGMENSSKDVCYSVMSLDGLTRLCVVYLMGRIDPWDIFSGSQTIKLLHVHS